MTERQANIDALIAAIRNDDVLYVLWYIAQISKEAIEDEREPNALPSRSEA